MGMSWVSLLWPPLKRPARLKTQGWRTLGQVSTTATQLRTSQSKMPMRAVIAMLRMAMMVRDQQEQELEQEQEQAVMPTSPLRCPQTMC